MRNKFSIALLIIFALTLILTSCRVPLMNKEDDEIIRTPIREVEDQSIQGQEIIRNEIEASVHATQSANELRPTPVMVDENFWPLWQYPMLEMIEKETMAVLDSALEVPVLVVITAYDEQITYQEIVNIVIAIEEIRKDIEDVNFIFEVYYDVNAEFAAEAITYLIDIQAELKSMDSSLLSLAEIVYRGVEINNVDMEPLINASIDLKISIDNAKENSECLFLQYEETLDGWKAEWLMITPNVEVSEPVQMFDLLDEYIDLVYECTDDEMLDHEEIESLLQASVNARHAIESIGGEDMQTWAESLSKMNQWLIDGDGMQIRYGFKNFALPITELRKQYE